MLTYTGEHLEKRLLEPLGGQSLSISADNLVATLHFDGVCVCVDVGLGGGGSVFIGGSSSIFADNFVAMLHFDGLWLGGGVGGGAGGVQGESLYLKLHSER